MHDWPFGLTKTFKMQKDDEAFDDDDDHLKGFLDNSRFTDFKMKSKYI